MFGNTTTNGLPDADIAARLLGQLPADPEVLGSLRDLVLREASLFDPMRDPLAASVAAVVAALRERASAVRQVMASGEATHIPDAAAMKAPEAMPQPDHATVPPASQIPAGQPADATRWSLAEKQLYEDVLNLFDLGDHLGAMTSLERLVMLAPEARELESFLDKNQELLVRLYRDHLGSLDRVTLPVRDSAPIKIPAANPTLMLDVLRFSDGHRPIKELIRKIDAPELRILLTLSHLARSGFLSLS
jgi:hypothetical protein